MGIGEGRARGADHEAVRVGVYENESEGPPRLGFINISHLVI